MKSKHYSVCLRQLEALKEELAKEKVHLQKLVDGQNNEKSQSVIYIVLGIILLILDICLEYTLNDYIARTFSMWLMIALCGFGDVLLVMGIWRLLHSGKTKDSQGKYPDVRVKWEVLRVDTQQRIEYLTGEIRRVEQEMKEIGQEETETEETVISMEELLEK